jgi:hypothetical protein
VASGGRVSANLELLAGFPKRASVSGRDHFLDPAQPGRCVREADGGQSEQVDMADLVR